MKKLLVVLLGLLAVSGAFASTATSFGDPAPFAETVFVRGGFNGWGTDNAMTWDGSAYTAVISLAAGDYEFKIANEGWDSPDFGAGGDPMVVLGTPTSVAQGPFANLMLSISTDSTYLFTMYDVAPDMLSATLEVVKIVPIPAAGLLLLSALGGLGFLRRRR